MNKMHYKKKSKFFFKKNVMCYAYCILLFENYDLHLKTDIVINSVKNY